jgi:hypothetical protein
MTIPTVAVMIATPILPIAEYARITGQSIRTITNDMDTGLIPVYQRKKDAKRFVNMIALTQMASMNTAPIDPWNKPQQVATA